MLNDTWLRLHQALDKVHPPSVADFFRLAAHKVRQVLLDMAEEHRRRATARRLTGTDPPGRLVDPSADSSDDPARLLQWSDFHDAVAQLPEPERLVVELRFYTGLTNEEIARVLGLHPRKVSYLWVAATERIADHGLAPEDLFPDCTV